MAGAVGFGVLSAVLAGLIGATWIGAEWSSRSLVALLFWVPQRMRVMGTKIAVLVGAALLLGVVAQAGWLAMSGSCARRPATVRRSRPGSGATCCRPRHARCC